ncbi:MAG: hypothetical protein K6V36_06955 [Anaerolineae bacterium]|nr:hypothetical protein [Anaerolineae bacterium]
MVSDEPSAAFAPTERSQPESSKPTLAPTLVIGLGGTGTEVVRFLKRRLVWLWHRQEIEQELARCPRHIDPLVWQEEIWRRHEFEGGPPIIQLLAVDTCPWANRAGQVYLCRHEYAYIGGYNALKVLRRIAEDPSSHPEISDWWGRTDLSLRDGQIHSGAKQIRAVGRLSLYRRYREFWSQLWPKIDQISSIQARQDTEKKGYPVAPSGETRRVYIVSSLCGGTGAGIFLDVAARVRTYLKETAIITGIFALPSVFLAELQSDIQRGRIQANAYAALKELNYFQNNPLEVQLPGEEREPAVPLFTRLYLVERQNKAGESLNSRHDVSQLIANQIFLESMTDIGSEVWARDVNVTLERRRKGGRLVSYVSSSFANSSLLLPRDQMVTYCELKYVDQLISGLAPDREGLGAQMENDLNMEARLAFERLAQVVGRIVRGPSATPPVLPTAPLSLPSLGQAGGAGPSAPAASAGGAIEQLEQEVNKATGQYALTGGLYFIERLSERIAEQVEACRLEQERREQELQKAQEELHKLASRRPWVEHIPQPFSALVRPRRAAYQRQLTTSQRNLARAQGGRNEAVALREQWIRLQTALSPLQIQIAARWETVRRIREEEIGLGVRRLFQEGTVREQQPYEMFTMVVGREYIEEALWPQIQRQHLAARLLQDVRLLLEDPNLCRVRVVPSPVTEAGTREHPPALELVPSETETLTRLLRSTARRAVEQAIPSEALHMYTFLRSPHSAIQTRLRDFFNRCQPFWRYDLDRGGLSESDLERVVLVGVRNAADPDWKYLLSDFSDFEMVDTDDPARLDACRIEHGLPIDYLESLPEMKRRYDEFFRDEAGPLHLDYRWEPDGELALPELIGDPPRRQRVAMPSRRPSGTEGEATLQATSMGTGMGQEQPASAVGGDEPFESDEEELTGKAGTAVAGEEGEEPETGYGERPGISIFDL